MSRSYKKYMVSKDECSKYGKKMANRMVRLYKDTIPNGGAYKKLYCSWNICDYWQYVSWKEFCNEHHVSQLVKGSEAYRNVYRQWYKYYKSK